MTNSSPNLRNIEKDLKELKDLLRLVQSKKALFKVVTFETSNPSMSPLNKVQSLKARFIATTFDVFAVDESVAVQTMFAHP